jgi:hypothetical protein
MSKLAGWEGKLVVDFLNIKQSINSFWFLLHRPEPCEAGRRAREKKAGEESPFRHP